MTTTFSRRTVLASGIAALAAGLTANAATGAKGKQTVRIVTSAGEIIVVVDTDHAPVSAGNFLEYADRKLYDGGQFYRSVHPENDSNPVKISVLQGGIGDRDKALPPIAHETTQQTGIRHLDGTLSVGRREPGTGTAAAFFICIGDQPGLDFGGKRNPDGLGFAAFGRVTKGMEIVREIWMRPTAGSDGSIGAQILAAPVPIETVRRVG
jgi:peptidyl-prolyl cis-trans isomerase A (cyclophilin A)